MWASERAKRFMILHKTGPVLGEVTPTASFISPGVGFKNQTHLWSSHQNSEEKNMVVLLFYFCVQDYGKKTEAVSSRLQPEGLLIRRVTHSGVRW